MGRCAGRDPGRRARRRDAAGGCWGGGRLVGAPASRRAVISVLHHFPTMTATGVGPAGSGQQCRGSVCSDLTAAGSGGRNSVGASPVTSQEITDSSGREVCLARSTSCPERHEVLALSVGVSRWLPDGELVPAAAARVRSGSKYGRVAHRCGRGYWRCRRWRPVDARYWRRSAVSVFGGACRHQSSIGSARVSICARCR